MEKGRKVQNLGRTKNAKKTSNFNKNCVKSGGG